MSYGLGDAMPLLHHTCGIVFNQIREAIKSSRSFLKKYSVSAGSIVRSQQGSNNKKHFWPAPLYR